MLTVCRVLLVTFDRDLMQLLRDYLVTAGFSVVDGTCTERAAALLREGRVDAVLVEADGLRDGELADLARGFPTLRLVEMGEPGVAAEARSDRVEVLKKPVSLRTIAHTLGRLAERAPDRDRHAEECHPG